MSMGYDEDDPRGAAVEAKLLGGVWKLQPGDKPAPRRTRSVPYARAWHGSFNRLV